jgi:hypothetical protein
MTQASIDRDITKIIMNNSRQLILIDQVSSA